MITAAISVLFGAALRALIMACVLWAGLRLLRVRNVRAQKTAWSVVLVAAFAMPALLASPWMPDWAAVRLPAVSWPSGSISARPHVSAAQPAARPIPQSPSAEPSAPTDAKIGHRRSTARKDEDLNSLPVDFAPLAPVTEPPAALPAANAAPKAHLIFAGLSRAAWQLYLAVSLMLLFRLLFGLATSLRLWLRAEPIYGLDKSGLHPEIPVRASRFVSSPVNIGSGIVLPADYLAWEPETLRVVLAHEGSHVRQRDFYLQLAAGVYAAVVWMSPLGWWLKRKLSELSEVISDRAGLAESASGPAYAQLLLEFAARPRPTLVGVPMAHKANLSQRIDGLLNDANFTQAFSGTRRALIGAVVVPLVLVALTATVRVKAAAAPNQIDFPVEAKLGLVQPPALSAATGRTTPAQAQATESSAGQTPPAPPTPEAAPAVPGPQPAPAPGLAPVPPPPPDAVHLPGSDELVIPPMPPIDVRVDGPRVPKLKLYLNGYDGHASCFADGDAYAIVGDPGTPLRFCGSTAGEMEAEVEKARTVAHGHFLLFRHDGKYYVIDDPATVSTVEAMEEKVRDQGEQMRDFSKQYRAMGEQFRDQARKQREETAKIPTPDLSKEMADLNAAVASLQAQKGATVTREQLEQISRSVNELQRQLIGAEIGTQIGAGIDAQVRVMMDQFRAQEGDLNKQMSQLGEELGRTVLDNQQKIGSIIDDSLKDGKARPVN